MNVGRDRKATLRIAAFRPVRLPLINVCLNPDNDGPIADGGTSP